MSKIFKTYLSFFSILLFTGIANLNANVTIGDNYNTENFEQLENTTNQTYRANLKKEVHFDTSKQENQENFPAEIIEIELEEEEEEISEEEHHFPTDAYQSTFFKIQLVDDLSFQEHKELIGCKDRFYTSSTKLYIRFQVFII